MANQVVRYVITADAQQATRELSRGADAADGINKKIGGLAKGAALYLGAQALGHVKAFVDDSVRAFSDLEQSVGGTEAVFGDAGRIIDEFASKSATSMGLSEAEFRTATTSIGGQLKRMTGDVEFAAERSVFLTGVAADLAATYGGTTAEAVQALGAAFRGEADPAERFNLNLKASVVNAKAVEMGLARTTTEVDENARAQAILALVAEQSADAQGQFAREQDTVAGQAQITAATLENQKAIVGESLQAYKEWGNYLSLEMGKALGQLALDLQNVTGSITDGEHALRSYELANGEAVTTLEDLSAAVTDLQERSENVSLWENIFNDPRGDLERFGRNFPEIIEAMDLTHEELVKLNEEQRYWVAALGLSEEEAAALAEVLEKELHQSQVEVDEQAARGASEWLRNRDAMEEAEGAAEDLAEATWDQVEALNNLREAKRRDVDATFNLIVANREVKTAQEEYNQAVEEFGPSSEEAQEAAQNLWEKDQALIDAALTFKNEAGPNWEAGFRRQMESAGVSEETIQGVLDVVNNLEGKIKDVNGSTIDIKANVRVPKFQFDQDGNYITPRQTGTAVFARGGIVTGPTNALIGEAGTDEAVIPLNSQGESYMAKVMERVLGRLDSPQSSLPPINITVNALDPQAAARAVKEALDQWIRTNGFPRGWMQ